MKKIILLFLAILLWFNTTLVFCSDPVSVATRKIILATDNYPPFFGSGMVNGGYFSEITILAFQTVGYECEVKFLPWKRAYELAKRGKYDGVLGIFHTEERTLLFEFSVPVAESRLAFFTKKERSITWSKINDLKPYRIGHIMGYHYTEDFDSADYLKKIKAYSIEGCIKMLIRNQVDIIVATDSVLTFYLNTDFPEHADALKMIGSPLTINKMYVSISKKRIDNQKIILDFNHGLTLIKKDGRFEKIKKNMVLIERGNIYIRTANKPHFPLKPTTDIISTS